VNSLPTAVFALLAALQVDVRSSTNCPSSEAVAARLAPLLPSGETRRGRDSANVAVVAVGSDGSTELRIELSSDDGARIGERRVSSQRGCEEMAQAVAVILAAWETDLRPATAGPVDAQARRDERPTASPMLAPALRGTRARAVAGAGGGIAVVGGLAGAVKLDLAIGTVASPWQLTLDAAAESSREITLAGGQVDWRHSTAGIALGWRSLRPKLALSIHGGAVLGWATLAGSRFGANHQGGAFEYGLAGALRLGRKWGRWQIWVEAEPRLWLRGQRAVVTSTAGLGESAGEDLPIMDLMVCAGASVVAFP
jgi:hypothetical protein